MKTSRTLIILSFLSFLFISSNLSAQKPPIKFGDVSKADLEMTHYSLDSGASAVVLCDYGVSSLVYSPSFGDFVLQFQKHVRIKILNEDGLKWANAEVTLYHKDGSSEKLNSLKAVTYNLVSGKLVKEKMKGSSEFKEKLDSYNDKIKFTLPNVRVGSVIEYSYTIDSEFVFNFQDWTFQRSIPVAWSEYRTYIPEYYQYQVITKGHLPFLEATRENLNDNIVLTSKSRNGYTKVSTSFENTTVTFLKEYRRWVIKDVPAFKEEPIMTSPNNFVSNVSYELAYIKWPNRPTRDIMGSWQKLNQRYFESSFFGSPMRSSNFLNKELEGLALDGKTDEEKIAIIYNHVKNRVRWNGVNRRSLTTNLRDPYENGEGTSAEVNLILTSMLQKAGIAADPVLCSTRGHGLVQEAYPITEQFNNVLCKIELADDNYILIDATDRYLPINILPKRCMNSVGWVVSKNNSGFVRIVSNNKVSKKVSGSLTLEETGNVSGELEMEYTGYSGRDKRKDYVNDGSEEYINSRIDGLEWEINELAVENEEELSSPFIEKFDVESFTANDELGDVIYLQSKFAGATTTSPFKSDTRTYPVDFPHPIENMYYVNINIPEGYIVESIPEPFAVALPDKGGKYSFQVSVRGNQLNVYTKLAINQRFFAPEHYAYLKGFYDHIIAKEKELIVLKKAS